MGLFFRAIWKYLLKCKVHMPFDPAIMLLRIYPKGVLAQLCKMCMCTSTCVAALFVVPQTG